MPQRACLACGRLSRAGSYCSYHKGTGARGSTRAWRTLRQAIIQRDGGCVVCGTNEGLEVHHRVPKRKGGSDDPSNLVTMCHEHHVR